MKRRGMWCVLAMLLWLGSGSVGAEETAMLRKRVRESIQSCSHASRCGEAELRALAFSTGAGRTALLFFA